jgi:hypothetical protein
MRSRLIFDQTTPDEPDATPLCVLVKRAWQDTNDDMLAAVQLLRTWRPDLSVHEAVSLIEESGRQGWTTARRGDPHELLR